MRAGTVLSVGITASGSPTEFEADFAGNAPSGISLNKATGQFSGTPKVPGNYSFLARAKNAQGWSLPKFTTLAVLPAAPPSGARVSSQATIRGFSLTSSSAPEVYQVGQAMTYTPSVSSSANFFIFGDLPPGLAGNTSTGEISGIPEKPGYFDISIRPFSDSAVGEEIEVSFTILPIAGTPVMSSSLVINGTAGTELADTLTATPAPVGFNVTDLPDFVLVDPLTGAVSGTPNTPGTYTFQASAFSAIGEGMPVTVTVEIAPAAGTPVVALQQPLPALQVGVPFSATLTSAPAATFYDSGSLPYGINLDPETGILSGTPLEPGQSEVPVWGVNAAGQGGSLVLNFDIAGAAGTPIITTPEVVRALAGESLALQLTSAPAATNYALSPVPAGLTFDPATGLLSGDVAVGSYNLTVSGTNLLGEGTTKIIRLEVFADASSLWRDETFGASANDPAVAGWDASPAKDGVSNLLKYALGLPVFTPAGSALPFGGLETHSGEQYRVFTTPRNPAATDVQLTPEITTDLKSVQWNSGAAHLTVIENTPTLLKVRDNMPARLRARGFFRVRAVLSQP